ncbi:MAG: hemerythrin domain-containing protein [Acidobacteria bacterium]|jgi:hemerythrin-like domain-containing protein|nr:hemerythrin domain-containing protein [Acidobacteriota bacterium]
MSIQIGAKPDSGFDNPLGMLQDCHRRIERFLHVLCVVAVQASGRSLNPEESSAVTAALHYFQEGGRRHNADEEESLFPRLRAAQPDDAQANLAHLEADHRRTEQLHHLVENLYRMWIDSATLSSSDQQALLSATSELQRIYTEHIRLEELTVFPRAAQLLDKTAIAAIGSEFQARRK